MPQFRYPMTGKWWKGNTHIHSTLSDGDMNFRELAELYRSAGYDFLFRTDHWAASDAHSDPEAYPLLWLDGVELDGDDTAGAGYHVVALGSFQGLEPGLGLQPAMEAARAQGGMLILAHPHWTGNTFDDALRWQFDGVEVYNHICRWLNGKGDGGPYWSAMLARNPNTLAFAADDTHVKDSPPGWNGGWVMVNAEACTSEAVLAALRVGNFYASCGPSFETIEYDGEALSFRCSPVQVARLVGPAWRGDRTGMPDGSGAPANGPVTQATFKIPPDWAYAYLEIEDEQGRRAWTNPLFFA